MLCHSLCTNSPRQWAIPSGPGATGPSSNFLSEPHKTLHSWWTGQTRTRPDQTGWKYQYAPEEATEESVIFYMETELRCSGSTTLGPKCEEALTCGVELIHESLWRGRGFGGLAGSQRSSLWEAADRGSNDIAWLLGGLRQEGRVDGTSGGARGTPQTALRSWLKLNCVATSSLYKPSRNPDISKAG